MTGWSKKNPALIKRLNNLMSDAPVVQKNFFGNVAWFLNSNDLMFAGAWGTGLLVRVGQTRAVELIESGDAEPFDPSGHRPKREYVYLVSDRIADDDTLLNWIEQGIRYAQSLPPRCQK